MDTLYQSESFTVTHNRVIQGDFEAVATSANEMSSTYQSPANASFPRHLEFKFSLNGKDNELPFGSNHVEVLRPTDGKVTVPLRVFGEQDETTPEAPAEDAFLEPNTEVTFQLDLSPVLEAFEQEGFYEGTDGSRLAKEDFIGVFIAGNREPLSWDFENLLIRPYTQLKDEDGDGIYTVTLGFNVYNEENFTASEWKATVDVSQYPTYTSGKPLLDAFHVMSLEELVNDVWPEQTFKAGKSWGGVRTRDISYSILLSLAILEPEISMNSLRFKTGNGRVTQDTGTGGAWPISTDRMTWSLAAWGGDLTTGDKAWLQEAYGLLRTSAEHDLKTIQDPLTGLMKGESSFLDWRKQSYPRWMGPIDIYNSLNLGTNAVHYQTYRILDQMAEELGEPTDRWDAVAEQIKQGINEHLWVAERGYYAQYLYGREFMQASERSEALGEALCVLFGIAEGERAQQVVANTPVVKYGVPCFYPQIPDISPYHNNGIWPFVQAYYTWAAAEANNAEAVSFGMAGLYRAAGLFLTNKENMVAESGDFEGTEINSDAQLWSVAGNLSMVYRILMGTRFSASGIEFKPFVPEAYAGEHVVQGMKYRNATFNVTVTGWGNRIASVNGDASQAGTSVVFPSDVEGTVDLVIELTNSMEDVATGIHLVENRESLPTPNMASDSEKLLGGGADGEQWRLMANGMELDNWPSMLNEHYNETSLRVADTEGYWSFISEPDDNAASVGRIIEAESFGRAVATTDGAQGYSGAGFVKLTKQQNLELTATMEIQKAGWYRVDVRYSNGSGRINTNNQCALRSLYLDEQPWGVLVMPQLGLEEWSTWGYSNGLRRYFEPGTYSLALRFEDHNENMNFETNTAFLDHLRVVPLPGEPTL